MECLYKNLEILQLENKMKGDIMLCNIRVTALTISGFGICLKEKSNKKKHCFATKIINSMPNPNQLISLISKALLPFGNLNKIIPSSQVSIFTTRGASEAKFYKKINLMMKIILFRV